LDSNTNIFLRADGDGRIGLGHVHRLLALVEVLHTHFVCRFVIRDPLPGLRLAIENAGSGIVPLTPDGGQDDGEWSSVLTGNEIVVVDGYQFDTKYQEYIKRVGSSLLCIDDINAYPFVADVIINPAGGVDMESYVAPATTKKFSGPRYAPVKPAFVRVNRANVQSESHNILICMGGADPGNFTERVFRALTDLPFHKAYLIVGEAYAHRASLMSCISSFGRTAEVLSNCTSSQLAAIMGMCDVAVCSASGVSYEYLTVGGELYIVQTADNQKLMYQFLISEGLAFDFGKYRVQASEVVRSTEIQARIFDGQAHHRIRKIFWELDFNLNVSIRRASSSDLHQLFEWTNDPEVRKQSFNSDLVKFEEHKAWFNKKMVDPLSVIYIFEVKRVAVAVVRFEIGKNTVINYSLDKHHRGKGWGSLVLQRAILRFFEEHAAESTIIGYVKPGNAGSCRAFESAGFSRSETKEYGGSYKFVYKRNG
jgi:UDP-2,4-diacetamido-2,4,6-trideoxy-beta-L-altropyranose hydrolase